MSRDTRRIQERIRPFLPLPLEHHLDAVPGVALRTIEVLIAELGSDVKPFPTSSQAASWVGLVPNNELSAGKMKRRRIKPRNRWLKRDPERLTCHLIKRLQALGDEVTLTPTTAS